MAPGEIFRFAQNDPDGLDQIELAGGAADGAAFGADAADDQAVAADAEVVLAANGVADLGDFFAVELDQLVAPFAVQMIVLGVAVVVLVNVAAGENHVAEQPGFDQLAERTVDGRPADVPVAGFAAEVLNQVFGVEMVVALEDFVDDDPPLLRGPLAAALQELVEPLRRRESDANGS